MSATSDAHPTSMVDVRRGVLKNLQRTFDVGHLAEAFDILFDKIKVQEDEIKVLKSKVSDVDVLKSNVSELTKCLKTLEYNIQGYEVKPVDALLPAVDKEIVHRQQEIASIESSTRASTEASRVTSPIGDEKASQPHSPPLSQPTTPKKAVYHGHGTFTHPVAEAHKGGSHYKSLLYFDPATEPKKKKAPTSPQRSNEEIPRSINAISYERKRNCLYRLKMMARTLPNLGVKYKSILNKKNKPHDSLLERIRMLEYSAVNGGGGGGNSASA